MAAGAMFSAIVMGALLVAFFVYGPKAIGGGIDETLAILIGMGFTFAWWTGRRSSSTFYFPGNDVIP